MNAKEQYWREVLPRFAKSGLTQAEFCRQEKLSVQCFGWWKREIAKRDAKTAKKGSSQAASKQSLLAAWRKIIARFNTSGLSKEDFCKKEGIKPAAFSWWRGEISRRDVEKSQAVAVRLPPDTKVFVPVRVEAPAPSNVTHGGSKLIAEINCVMRTVRIFETATSDNLLTLVRLIKELSYDR